ncbi:3-oxoacyl- acyl-carrier-protein synthase III [Musa troglodytarum]|uniref:3-oxoacyl- acyl-carrier-protein synthase III n=1 Tax=Musa troglodytarum TaxID=320322 RepID=A0A9E7GC88_9LILI|nr:3-oxoacyl- acyl-carrier-protein synthase III [Musa troglodytarum]
MTMSRATSSALPRRRHIVQESLAWVQNLLVVDRLCRSFSFLMMTLHELLKPQMNGFLFEQGFVTDEFFQVQRDLGCKNAWAFDVTAACSGFIVGLITATRFIKGGGFQNILVIGADALSRYVDWTDRGTCILFGDAAGAVLVQACHSDEDGLLGFDLHSDGHGHRQLNALAQGDDDKLISNSNGAPLFPPRKSSFSCIQMNGKEVFRFAVRCVPQSIEAALEEAGLTSSSIDWLLLHQANQRIIDGVSNRLEIPSDKVISNLANYGNTSAASIPLALDEAIRGGKIQAGNTIATAGFGAGLTWGSAIIRWG